jgi:energy-coupling factor transporter ATP-binding protein EcfA2
MGIAELKASWEEHAPKIAEDYEEWDEQRKTAVGSHLDAMRSFLAGEMNVDQLRSRIDSLSKSEPYWGFRGTSQMFFNQLVKAAEWGALEAALHDVLPAPVNEEDAHGKLERFAAAVGAAREHAEAIGVTQPGVGRIDAFASFFWELQEREEWPVFYPNSRNMLEQHGLLDVAQPQPDLYVNYRRVVHELRDLFGTDTWGVEHLLWRLGKGAPEEESEEDDSAAPQEGVADIYASYRQRDLYFPDEVVTSLVLSLATKRFVILSGISGTGKTKIATGLAAYLEETNGKLDDEVEPPKSDAEDHYLQLTAPKIKRGFISLTASARSFFESTVGLPERGGSRLYPARLPDGSRYEMRLNNIGFAAASRELYRLYFRKDMSEWVRENARPGDFVHLVPRPGEGIDFDLDIVHGVTRSDEGVTDLHSVIAVKSDWTDPRGLLGYFNPLTSTYVRTDLIELMLRAGDDPDRPYLVILDEMNLARVEYYFSDFLSALESDEPLTLMPAGAADESAANLEGSETELPAELAIPPNISFLGTVNVDETTHPFSAKVLDRANVIEFNDVDVERALGHGDAAPGKGLRLENGALDSAWLCTVKEEALAIKAAAHEVEDFTSALEDVHGMLAMYNLQFGYRVIDEISAFVGHALDKVEGEPAEVVRAAFDLQLQQKVIPKLSGGRELEEPLARLLHYCLEGERGETVDVEAVQATARGRLEPLGGGPPAAYPGSARKLLRMLHRLGDIGFVGALE